MDDTVDRSPLHKRARLAGTKLEYQAARLPATPRHVRPATDILPAALSNSTRHCWTGQGSPPVIHENISHRTPTKIPSMPMPETPVRLAGHKFVIPSSSESTKSGVSTSTQRSQPEHSEKDVERCLVEFLELMVQVAGQGASWLKAQKKDRHGALLFETLRTLAITLVESPIVLSAMLIPSAEIRSRE